METLYIVVGKILLSLVFGAVALMYGRSCVPDNDQVDRLHFAQVVTLIVASASVTAAAMIGIAAIWVAT